jgi:hypothetical protein
MRLNDAAAMTLSSSAETAATVPSARHKMGDVPMPRTRQRTGAAMPLMSTAFRGDPRLEACFVSDAAHIMLGARGPHVGKIQKALIIGGSKVIGQGELNAQLYGPQTAASVLHFKQKMAIINRNYQSRPDAIVGKQTIGALDIVMLSLDDPNVLPVPAFGERGIASAILSSPEALMRIKTAQARLSMAHAARNTGNMNDANLRSANWHFKIHRARDALAQLIYLCSVFAIMERELKESIRTNGASLFEVANEGDDGDEDDMLTFPGGYSYSKIEGEAMRPNPTKIFIWHRTAVTPAGICHELAHYSGGRAHTRHTIRDNVLVLPFGVGRALRGRHNYAEMTADEAANNAISYESFCFPDRLAGRTPPDAID